MEYLRLLCVGPISNTGQCRAAELKGYEAPLGFLIIVGGVEYSGMAVGFFTTLGLGARALSVGKNRDKTGNLGYFILYHLFR
jgi:hypothetical protein